MFTSALRNLLYPILALLCLFTTPVLAQSKTKAAIPFAYLPENTPDAYNQPLPHKTIVLSQNEFVILSKRSGTEYAVERYRDGLKKAWTATLPLQQEEQVEAFFKAADQVLVVTHRNNGQAQQLYGHQLNLQTGQLQQPVLLLEAPAGGRRISVATSPDGAHLLAYRYDTDARQQIKSISGSIYSSSLSKLKDTRYNLSDLPAIFSAVVTIDNEGSQYISLLSDHMNRLSVRQYNLKDNEAKGMSVLVGGVFEGQQVYIIDSKYALLPDGNLYGAVLIANQKTGEYHSLKAVRFDFEAEDMVFAEEFRFTPAYLARLNTADQAAAAKATRLEDIYLSDLYLTPEKKLVVLAEKKYTEGGEGAPYFAKELHLFTYGEYMDLAWNSVVLKNQQAPANEAFTAISYRANLAGNTLQLLTLEDLNGKRDLYLRNINTSNGAAEAPKALGLGVANDKILAYVKDFTAWLGDKTLVTVVRPAKKAAGLQLRQVQLR